MQASQRHKRRPELLRTRPRADNCTHSTHGAPDVEFARNRLHPFRYPLLLPEKLNRESREVEIRVAFSEPTFTRGCSIAEDPDYHYSTAPRDLRKFCPNRYELSKILPDVVRSLDVRKCFFTDRNNYFVVELPEPLPAGFEYRVFFDVRGVAEPNAVLLFIQSAYAGDTRKSPRGRRGERSDSGCW